MDSQKTSMPMPIEVKASIWTLVLLCILQVAAPVIAVLAPVVGPMESGVGFRDPWLPSWSAFSCASIPVAIINFCIAAIAIVVVSRKVGDFDSRVTVHLDDVVQGCTPRRDVRLLCWVMVADVCVIAYSFLLGFLSQLGFVPPPGSS
jgi:uncharacterized membrane protein YhdT